METQMLASGRSDNGNGRCAMRDSKEQGELPYVPLVASSVVALFRRSDRVGAGT
jgi:hypothetical protein